VGRSIYNQAYLDGLVFLAPNDASEGVVVDPQSNAACWYPEFDSYPLKIVSFTRLSPVFMRVSALL
jgi:hypothetical protein